MLKNKMKSVIALALATLKIKELPKGEDGALSLSPEQEASLKTIFKGENYATFVSEANKILAEKTEENTAENAEVDKANEILASVLKGNAGDEEDPDNNAEANAGATEKKTSLSANAQAAANKIAEQQQQIDTMAQRPEADEVVRTLATGAGMGKKAAVAALLLASTPTHLFGIEKNEFARSRPWNERAAKFLSGNTMAGVTDFTDTSTIANLNEDLKQYYTKNPEVLRELQKDTFGLPAFWPKRFNVVNGISDAVVDVADVTQGRKANWAPGSELMIEAEKRKNYPVQIDIQFSGYELQQLETSWLNTLFNFDGSNPYKSSFIGYIIGLIDKQARIEDRISSINGVYVYKPKQISNKGFYLNRQNGLKYQLWRYRDIDKKIIPFKSKLGALTLTNAYDYFKEFAAWLPNNIRTKTGMKIYTSRQLINANKAGYKAENSLNMDYAGDNINYIEGYPNLEFVELIDLEGSMVFFMTDDKNIEILEDVPNEKSIYKIEQSKRDTYVMADYKQTAAFVFSGFNLAPNSPFLGQAQFIWINDAPLFNEDFKVPMYGNVAGAPVTVNFNRIKTDMNLISDVVILNTDLTTGQIIEIEGNTAQQTASVFKDKTSPNGGNMDLTEDFDPKSGGTLTLLKTADGWKELGRTSGPTTPTVPDAKEFTSTSIDANEASEFKYKGTAAATLATILNGVEGAEIKIYGQATNALTVANVTGKIVVGSSYAMDAPTEFIVLKKFGGTWFEIARG